jgi:hypothetical protein
VAQVPSSITEVPLIAVCIDHEGKSVAVALYNAGQNCVGCGDLVHIAQARVETVGGGSGGGDDDGLRFEVIRCLDITKVTVNGQRAQAGIPDMAF